MTQPEPSRQGIAPWARYTLAGCGGCLLVALLVMIVGSFFMARWISQNVKFEPFDAAAKPDPPSTATADQLLPRRVGLFVRESIGHPRGARPDSIGEIRVWEGVYAADGKKVTLIVAPAEETRRAQERSPFSAAMRQQGADPKAGTQMRLKVGDRSLQMVLWIKENWGFVIQSEHGAAVEFARLYRPGGGK